MARAIDHARFRTELLDLLEETFETHHGIFLDKGTSLFETLRGVTHAEASAPAGSKGATIAAHVAHVEFYLQVLQRHIRRIDAGPTDWGEVWRTVAAVTPPEWLGLQEKLRETYRVTAELLRGVEDFNDENALGGALAIVVHSACHLGAIRQAVGSLRSATSR